MLEPRVLAPQMEPQAPAQDANALARQIVQIAADKKAENVIMLDIRGLSIIADYFVICSGTSDRQVRAVAAAIEEQLKAEGTPAVHVEGMADAHWVLLDYSSVIVHVFDPATRDYYRLEKLWAEAPRVLVVQ